MFIRKLKSPNGRTYVQVVDKSRGIYRVQKSFGSYISNAEEQILLTQAQQWIKARQGIRELDFSNSEEYLEKFFESITSMKRVGYDLLLGRIFDEIGKATFRKKSSDKSHQSNRNR